jgi:hypothetical protein
MDEITAANLGLSSLKIFPFLNLHTCQQALKATSTKKKSLLKLLLAFAATSNTSSPGSHLI